jgi:hypothetical protein
MGPWESVPAPACGRRGDGPQSGPVRGRRETSGPKPSAARTLER